MTQRVGLVYFSPGSTTKKIGYEMASGLGSEQPHVFDITSFQSRAEIIENPETVTKDVDYLILGAPVHSGKLPLQFIAVLKMIMGKGIKCCAFVVYGNRDYGIALHQMVEILSNNKFNVVGAAAFIGQHSYSDIIPVAVGRPDKSDLDRAFEFGKNSLTSRMNIELCDVPIQLDRMSRSEKYDSIKPVHLAKECRKCGKCAKKCPLNLLSSDTGAYLTRSSKKLCIGCMACVKACKTKARVNRVNPLVKLVIKNILKTASRERKEPFMITPIG